MSVYPPVGPNVLKYTCKSSRYIENEYCGKVGEFQMYGTAAHFYCDIRIMSH